MTAPLFRLDPLPADERVRLTGDEGRHAARVRRLRAGEDVVLTDGRGTVARGAVEAVEGDHLDIRVTRREVVPVPTPRIVVVQALVKGDRSELAVELLTEVGVDEILPWQAERCVARWSGEKSGRRWAAAAESAAKQSRRVHWPVVGEVLRGTEPAERLRGAGLAIVLSEAGTRPLTDLLPDLAGPAVGERPGEVVVVVGPEGGIAEGELAAFAEAGARSCRLGPTVLRASSAGLAAVSVLAATSRWSTG